MTLYFFDTQDGDIDTDSSGVELADDDEALLEAVRYAGSLIRDKPGIVNRQADFTVTVRSRVATIVRVRVAIEQP